MSPQFCSICKAKLNEIAKDRGVWFWCPGCGSLHREVNDKPMEYVASPGTVAALRLMQPPAPPTTPEAAA